MTRSRSLLYPAIAAAYYPAFALLLFGASWAFRGFRDTRVFLVLLAAFALAGVLVAHLLRRRIAAARRWRVLLVAIQALLLGTPIVVFAVLAFGTGALWESAHSLSSTVGGTVVFILVATFVTALNPFLWLVSSGFVSILRSVAEVEAAERSERASPGPLREPP